MECWDGAEIHFLIPSSWKDSLKTFKQKLKKKTNLSTLVIWGKGVPRKGLLLLLSHFSRVRLCVTPQTAAHQAPLPLGFSRQEHWSGLPCPSPMHESEKWKWSHSVVSNPQQPHGLQPSRLLHPWDFPGKSTGVGCHCWAISNKFQTSGKIPNYFSMHLH